MPFQKGQSGNPAGRPRKADKFAGQIAKAEARIAKNLLRYIENLETLADGVKVEDVNPVTGEVDVYTRPPDRAANQYLLNRILGKPTERKELSGPNGGPMETVGMTVEEWRAQAEQRRQAAEQTLAMLEDEDDA